MFAFRLGVFACNHIWNRKWNHICTHIGNHKYGTTNGTERQMDHIRNLLKWQMYMIALRFFSCSSGSACACAAMQPGRLRRRLPARGFHRLHGAGHRRFCNLLSLPTLAALNGSRAQLQRPLPRPCTVNRIDDNVDPGFLPARKQPKQDQDCEVVMFWTPAAESRSRLHLAGQL